ncbi:MAG: nucleotidyl transferase AbiEii/AbiGii toxin family protein [Candidatus Omnitrophota bacterium]|jgi:predicted nucleotidyltransferase component of viral defense system
MQDLAKQEQFELEVLEKLNSAKLLSNLVFCGGTMLRLCLGLNRYSVDLDFWVTKDLNFDELFNKLKILLSKDYKILDSANKFYTILFEIKSANYPRNLKIEIRKEKKPIKTESAIAYGKNSNTQVFLNAASLACMMQAKINAFLDRKEIRDCFDLEFLIKKGIPLDAPADTLKKLLKGIDALTKNDYTVKLGSLLEANERQYYSKENFKILKSTIIDKLGSL